MLGTVAGGTQYMDPSVGAPRAFFDQVDLDTGEVRRIPIGFLGHGFTQDPKRPARAAIFEKKGPGGRIVDLDALDALETVAASPGCKFYGHGLFSSDGASIFVVEASLDDASGRITVRDGETLSILDELPTYGTSPHDCVLVDGGRLLAITNGGGALGTPDTGSVAFVDLSTGALVEKLPITNERINAGHLAIASDGALAVVSAPRAGLPEETTPGGVSIRPAGGALAWASEPADVVARMLGESLSVCIHEPTGVALVTNPRGNLVTFWSVRDRSLLGTLEVKSPRGVTTSADGSSFVLACGLDATLVLVSPETRSITPGRDYGKALLSGSHAYLRAP
jgi:hypothetical protein